MHVCASKKGGSLIELLEIALGHDTVVVILLAGSASRETFRVQAGSCREHVD